MAATWSGGSSNYTSGTTTGGVLNTLAPIPSGYNLIKGQSWNIGSNKKRIFGDLWGYAERTSETTAKVYLCQRACIYNTGAANYAAWSAVTGNTVVRSTSGWQWAYNSTSAFSVIGSSTTSLGTFRWGSANSTYSPYGGSLALLQTGRSWWRQLFTITDIPVTATTSKITLSFGAVGGSYASEFETSGAWTADLPIIPMSAVYNNGGTWKHGYAWYNDGGTWKKGIPWINVSGTWKKA